MLSPVALCDVSRNGDSGPPNLCHQAVDFGLRKPIREPVALDDEIHGLFPNLEVSVALDQNREFRAFQPFIIAWAQTPGT